MASTSAPSTARTVTTGRIASWTCACATDRVSSIDQPTALSWSISRASASGPGAAMNSLADHACSASALALVNAGVK